MDCNIFYRITSDDRPAKKAIRHACLENFSKVFGDKFIVVADNCDESVLRHLGSLNLRTLESNLGNGGSFKYALKMATQLHPEAIVYFVEDDYLHAPAARSLIPEAVPYADYVTLYDDPDKYGPLYDGGEVSKVFRTEGGHWRFTENTTMTFAAQVKTLRDDYYIWLDGAKGDRPLDRETFEFLGKKGKTIAVAIPGACVHIRQPTDMENWVG